MKLPKIHVVLHIHAPATAVWSALTDPDQTARYWGGGTRIESDWRPGTKVKYRRAGSVTDEHTVIEAVEPERLSHTFEPQFGDFKDEAPSRVTVVLTQSGEVTKLELVHDEFEPQSKVFDQCSEAWPLISCSLKTMLETGRPLPEPSPES